MRIDHIAIYVNELERARDLFVKYFDGTSGEGYFNQKTGFRSYFISFESGARLEIMNRPNMADLPKDIYRTGYAHTAFSVGCREKVDQMTEKLKADGYDVLSGPRVTGDGYYESSVIFLEGNMIEITI